MIRLTIRRGVTSTLPGIPGTLGRRPAFFFLVLVCLGLAVACRPVQMTSQPPRLTLATTTSTRDSGFLDAILPTFTVHTGVTVDVIAVGTGQAMQLGRDGNADALLVHARALENAFMAEGHGLRREDVMYNDFVIVGPAADPADIASAASAADALAAIAAAQAEFVSRGDDSGTHVKEQEVWAAARIEVDPTANPWYLAAGQGMGAVLTLADEQEAYTLSDRATYLARTLAGTGLVILFEGDPILYNPYGIITVNPEKNPAIQGELADQFVDWFVSLPTQELIAEYGVSEFGQPLFVPDAESWRNR